MKVAFALLALTAFAHADLVIVQKVDGAGQTGEQTIRIKGGKARSDIAAAISHITDSATGDTITLKHTDKTFMKLPASQGQTMMDVIKKKRGDLPAPALQPTGKKEKVSNYECEIFKCDLGGFTVTYWLAKDYPNFAAIQEQLAVLSAGGAALAKQGLMPDPKTFPGMTMKTELELAGKKITTTTISVKEEAVDPAVFMVPADYKEQTSPELPKDK